MTLNVEDLTKPMLSGDLDGKVDKLRFPLLASPKLDGIRVTVQQGVLLSRNQKPIPNKRLQAIFGKERFNGIDGELIVGDPTAPDVFRVTSSGVMSIEGEPDAFLHVFDCMLHPDLPFHRRLAAARKIVTGSGRMMMVEQHIVTDLAELDDYEQAQLATGYEGVMLRDATSPYKQGRGTVMVQDLMKLKRFADAEAVVLGVEEQMRNTNTLERDNLGHAKRSTKKAGMVGKDTLGALLVKGVNGPYKGKTFSVGTGFDDELRRCLWGEHRGLYGKPVVGLVIKYKYFPSGSKDAPRFPVFLGFRDKKDMS